eukprot:TRINITY_DN25001_c0_g1_i1.p1 TRINITY_DN25001_c0_g1~~TRINITY_DN25001_c0_g1_i1.p1  ORF type:complete len:419 (+),score=201.68 TRINITY_DN25001_c0_g1_i1:109-1257(+)
MTIMLPGRFSTSELRSEAVYTGLNLLSLYHDSILDRRRVLVGDVQCGVETPGIKRLKHVLTFLHYSEVLIEMVALRVYAPALTKAGYAPTSEAARRARRRFVAGKWVVVLCVEAVKALCRLLMLRNNRGRMLILQSPEEVSLGIARRKLLAIKRKVRSGALPVVSPTPCGDDNNDGNSKEEAREEEEEVEDGQQDGEIANKSNNTERSRNVLARYSDLVRMYLVHGRGRHPHGQFSEMCNPTKVPRSERDANKYTPTRQQVLGEILNIVRPVVYVAARLVSKSDQAWSPFWLSLLTDIVSRALVGRMRDLHSPQQRNEVSRRMALWSYYLLRSPFFDNYTKRPLVRVGAWLTSMPVLGMFFGNLLDLVLALQTHYFYTAASS